jgi:pyruvate/2-oxoglutarate/acetoin dehydrogenase E1 component
MIRCCLSNMPLYAYQVRGEVPEEDYVVPIGVSDVKREGSRRDDYGLCRGLHMALEAAEQVGRRMVLKRKWLI